MTMNATSDLEKLQSDIEHLLLSDEALKHVTVARVRPRTEAEAAGIRTKLERTLAGLVARNGKSGLSIIVNMAEVVDAERNLRAITGMLRVTVDVIENILINMGPAGTGLSCEAVALHVAGLLQHRSFEPGRALVAGDKLVSPKPQSVLAGAVEYRVEFQVAFGMAAQVMTATPLLEIEANVVTLSCADDEAAIYYTLDGGFPGPGNCDAVHYSEPFTLEGEGPFEVRAAAYAEGLAPSGEKQVEIAGA